jgi:small subunit ribosomal protein S14
MKKKKFNYKDFIFRQNIHKFEDQRITLKTIQNSFFFPFQNRYFASFQLSKLKFSSFPTKIRNRCILTGRSRGVYNHFKLSRIMLKDTASRGLLPGIKKAS